MSEKVLIRDDPTKTLQWRRTDMWQDTIHTMRFYEVGDEQSSIEWECEVIPKCCFHTCVSRWMRDLYYPRHKEHYAANLKYEIDTKYFEEGDFHKTKEKEDIT